MNKVEELLLKAKKEDFQTKETRIVKSKFLGKKLGMGEPAEVTIRELSGRKATELSNMIFDAEGNLDKAKIFDTNLHLLVEGVVSPSMKNEEYKAHFGAESPKHLAEIVFGTDAIRIADEIKEMSGLTNEKEKEDREQVKN